MGHIFDNAAKYAMEDNEINITFISYDTIVAVEISMLSLWVEDEELDKIFEEKYSGKWSKESGLDGNGIGVYYVKKNHVS